jgi:hypothetical protein
LKAITTAHDEALQEATVGYLEALRSTAPVPPPTVPVDDMDDDEDGEAEPKTPGLVLIDDLADETG